jgi:hypothetical protein
VRHVPIARSVIGANAVTAANEANAAPETGVTRAAEAKVAIVANHVTGTKVAAKPALQKAALQKLVAKPAASVVRSHAGQNLAHRNLAVVVAGATTAVVVRRANQPLPAVASATV